MATTTKRGNGAASGLKHEDMTELRLGLPGTNARGSKRASEPGDMDSDCGGQGRTATSAKAQVVGWPPIRSYRKNSLFQLQQKTADQQEQVTGMYVKVSMDGAPYLRKIDLSLYKGYRGLLKALEDMFKIKVGVYSEREGYGGSEFVPTYEDKDGDLMLVGDVPWEMFASSCRRLRIIKASDAKGLGCGV